MVSGNGDIVIRLRAEDDFSDIMDTFRDQVGDARLAVSDLEEGNISARESSSELMQAEALLSDILSQLNNNLTNSVGALGEVQSEALLVANGTSEAALTAGALYGALDLLVGSATEASQALSGLADNGLGGLTQQQNDQADSAEASAAASGDMTDALGNLSSGVSNLAPQLNTLVGVTGNFATSMEGIVTGLNSETGLIGTVTAFTAAVAATAAAVGFLGKSGIDYMDQQARISTMTGLAIEEVDRWSTAMNLANVSSSRLSLITLRLGNSMEEAMAGGTSRAADALRELVPGLSDANAQAMEMDELLPLVFGSLQKMDEQTRNAAGSALFGVRAWREFIPLVKDFEGKMDAANGVLARTPIEMQQASDMTDRYNLAAEELGRQWTALAVTAAPLVLASVEAILTGINALKSATMGSIGFVKEHSAAFIALSVAIGIVAAPAVISALVSGLTALSVAMAAGALAAMDLTATMWGLSAAIVGNPAMWAILAVAVVAGAAAYLVMRSNANQAKEAVEASTKAVQDFQAMGLTPLEATLAATERAQRTLNSTQLDATGGTMAASKASGEYREKVGDLERELAQYDEQLSKNITSSDDVNKVLAALGLTMADLSDGKHPKLLEASRRYVDAQGNATDVIRRAVQVQQEHTKALAQMGAQAMATAMSVDFLKSTVEGLSIEEANDRWDFMVGQVAGKIADEERVKALTEGLLNSAGAQYAEEASQTNGGRPVENPYLTQAQKDAIAKAKQEADKAAADAERAGKEAAAFQASLPMNPSALAEFIASRSGGSLSIPGLEVGGLRDLSLGALNMNTDGALSDADITRLQEYVKNLNILKVNLSAQAAQAKLAGQHTEDFEKAISSLGVVEQVVNGALAPYTERIKEMEAATKAATEAAKKHADMVQNEMAAAYLKGGIAAANAKQNELLALDRLWADEVRQAEKYGIKLNDVNRATWETMRKDSEKARFELTKALWGGSAGVQGGDVKQAVALAILATAPSGSSTELDKEGRSTGRVIGPDGTVYDKPLPATPPPAPPSDPAAAGTGAGEAKTNVAAGGVGLVTGGVGVVSPGAIGTVASGGVGQIGEGGIGVNSGKVVQAGGIDNVDQQAVGGGIISNGPIYITVEQTPSISAGDSGPAGTP